MMPEIPGLCAACLLLAFVISAIVLLVTVHRACNVLERELMDAVRALDQIPATTSTTLWRPVNVAVVANTLGISPPEVDNEYRKEPDARKWIICNAFADNLLTRRMALEEGFHSRFLTVGYDYKSKEAPTAAATGGTSGLSVTTQSSIDPKSSSKV